MMNKITVAYLRDLEKQVSLGEISYSRMVELLNEKVGGESSPVRQQLTKEKILEIFNEYKILAMGHNKSLLDAAEAICQISVRPDEQKDETPLQVYKRNLKLQNEISELKEKIKILVDESHIVAEKLSEATLFANEQANKAHEYSKKLTSKESDVPPPPPPKSEAEVERQVFEILYSKSKYHQYESGGERHFKENDFQEAIKLLARLLSATYKGKYSEWISFDENKPKVGQKVLFWNKNEISGKYETRFGGIFGDNTWYAVDAYEDEIFKVNLWMPLPEAPESSNTNTNKK